MKCSFRVVLMLPGAIISRRLSKGRGKHMLFTSNLSKSTLRPGLIVLVLRVTSA